MEMLEPNESEIADKAVLYHIIVIAEISKFNFNKLFTILSVTHLGLWYLETAPMRKKPSCVITLTAPQRRKNPKLTRLLRMNFKGVLQQKNHCDDN